ncbi:MAG: flavodoxin family protein [Bacillota bacterium]
MLKSLLAISSSPRREGNSELLLESFVRGVQEQGWKTVTIRLNGLKFKPCQACDKCASTGECVLDDDMQTVYPQVALSDAIVMATPIYFGSVSGQLKIFIDRFQCWWHAKYNLGKPPVREEEGRPAFFICVGALRKKQYCENAHSVVEVFCSVINFNLLDWLCFRGIDEKGAIMDHPAALDKAFQAGRHFAELCWPRPDLWR